MLSAGDAFSAAVASVVHTLHSTCDLAARIGRAVKRLQSQWEELDAVDKSLEDSARMLLSRTGNAVARENSLAVIALCENLLACTNHLPCVSTIVCMSGIVDAAAAVGSMSRVQSSIDPARCIISSPRWLSRASHGSSAVHITCADECGDSVAITPMDVIVSGPLKPNASGAALGWILVDMAVAGARISLPLMLSDTCLDEAVLHITVGGTELRPIRLQVC